MAGECDKHDGCMERIHDDINEIKRQNAENKGIMAGFTNSINEFVSSIRRDVYAKDGLMTRVGTISNQVALQWGLLGVLVVAVVLQFLFNKH